VGAGVAPAYPATRVPSGTAQEPGDPPADSPSTEPASSASFPPSVTARHDPYAALRSPNYRRFALGFVCSATGLQMMGMALGWEVYERTGDPLALGFIGLARAAPVICLALPAGHIIDIVRSRKTVLVATQACFAILGAALAAASYFHLPLWLLYTLIVLTGCTRSFNGPSRQALLPQIVPEGCFTSAVTWNSGAFQFAAMGGPLLGGFLIARAQAAWPVYLAMSLGCGIFAISAAFLRPRPHTPSAGRVTARSMLAGLGHLWHEKTILAAITLDLFAVLFGGATALMPIYARDILDVGPAGLGALRAAPFIGALLMALVLAHRPPFRRAGWAMLLSVAGFGVATIIFGLSRWFPLSMAMLILLGGLDNISIVIRHVLVQMRTPEHLRGRVSAVNSVFIESSNELGAFESGAVAALFRSRIVGAVVSVVSGGVGTILVVVGVGWLWPQVRSLGRMEEPRP
jgi:MFS family permease